MEIKDNSEFPNPRLMSQDPISYRCSACILEQLRQKYAERADIREMQAHRARLSKYGITAEQFQAMLDAQQNRCAICNDPLGTGKQRAIDHDHETKKVRGVLCTGCNTAIGGLKERPTVAIRAAEYLRKHGK